MANGKGLFRNPEGYQYEGEWKDDHLNGFGVETWDKDGSRFEGEFSMNVKAG